MCWESYTAQKCFLGGHFLVSTDPDSVAIGKASTLPWKCKPTLKGCLIRFSLYERSWELRSVWNMLGHYGDTTWVWTWIPDFGGKICIFLSVDPEKVHPSNCLKIHPIAAFLLLTVIALVHPLWFLEQAGSLQCLAAGAFQVQCLLLWSTAPSTPKPTPAAYFLIGQSW